jgi:hypothetical protein
VILDTSETISIKSASSVKLLVSHANSRSTPVLLASQVSISTKEHAGSSAQRTTSSTTRLNGCVIVV